MGSDTHTYFLALSAPKSSDILVAMSKLSVQIWVSRTRAP